MTAGEVRIAFKLIHQSSNWLFDENNQSNQYNSMMVVSAIKNNFLRCTVWPRPNQESNQKSQIKRSLDRVTSRRNRNEAQWAGGGEGGTAELNLRHSLVSCCKMRLSTI